MPKKKHKQAFKSFYQKLGLGIIAIAAISAAYLGQTNLFTGFLNVQQVADFESTHINPPAFDAQFAVCPDSPTNQITNILKQKAIVEALIVDNTDSLNVNRLFEIISFYNTQTIEVNFGTAANPNLVSVPLLKQPVEIQTIEQGSGFVVYEDIQKASILVNSALNIHCNTQLSQNFENNKEQLYFALDYKSNSSIISDKNLFIHNLQDDTLNSPDPSTIEAILDPNLTNFNLFQITLNPIGLRTNQSIYSYQTLLFEADNQTINHGTVDALHINLSQANNFDRVQSGDRVENIFTVIGEVNSHQSNSFNSEPVFLTDLQDIQANIDFRKDYLMAIKINSDVPDSQSNFANQQSKSKFVYIHIKDRLQKLAEILEAQAASSTTIEKNNNNNYLFIVNLPGQSNNFLPDELRSNVDQVKLILKKNNIELEAQALSFTGSSFIFKLDNTAQGLTNAEFDSQLVFYDTQTINLSQKFVINDVALDATQDTDRDNIANNFDNCPNISNVDQTDTDSDGTGDACDNDIDGDGIDNAQDNCPNISNVDQTDTDSDGTGDACDSSDDTPSDLDADGIADTQDNCPNIANADQADADSDDIGDVCDIDSGIEDEFEIQAGHLRILNPNDVTFKINGTNLSSSRGDYKFAARNLATYTINSITLNSEKTEATITLGNVLACTTLTCEASTLFFKNASGDFQASSFSIEVAKAAFNIGLNSENKITGEIACLQAASSHSITATQADGTTTNITLAEQCDGSTPDQKITFSFDNPFSDGQVIFDVITDASSQTQHISKTINLVKNNDLSLEILKDKVFVCSNNNRSLPGTKTKCQTNLAIDETISDSIVLYIESTPFANARRLVSTQTDSGVILEATNIQVPNATGAQPSIKLAIRDDESSAVKTLSFIEIVDLSDLDGDGFSVTDKLDVIIDNKIEIGTNAEIEIEIPNNLKLGFLQVSYKGGESKNRAQKGAIFTHCSKDFVQNVDKAIVRRACDKFTKATDIQGPDSIYLDNFDTSKITASGDYDIKMVGYMLNPDGSVTKVQEIIRDAFEAIPQVYLINSQMGLKLDQLGQSYNPNSSILGRFFQNKQDNKPPNPKCMVLFRDIQMTNPLCNDLVYLHDLGIYKGQQIEGQVVSGIEKAALRAHMFTILERMLNNLESLETVAPDVRAMVEEIQDITPEMVQNSGNHWWMVPMFVLKHYGVINTDSAGNIEPFATLTQYEIAEILGQNAQLLAPISQDITADSTPNDDTSNTDPTDPSSADEATEQSEPPTDRVTEVVEFYDSIGITLKPDEPATIGDLLAITAKVIKIRKEPQSFQTQQSTTDTYRIYNSLPQNYQPTPYNYYNQQYQYQYPQQQQYLSPYQNYYPSYGYM